MTPRERVHAALQRRPTDRVPRLEVWIDALLEKFDLPDTTAAHAYFGQDGIMLPSTTPSDSNAWQTGIDEWGRVWKAGMYMDGVLKTRADLEKYSPPPAYADQFFEGEVVQGVRKRYPDHFHFFGTHIGPFMQSYMAMGMADFFMRIIDQPDFVHALLAQRTAWAIAVFQTAVQHGAELIIMGDDACSRKGPMISPAMWREFVLPYHQQIVDALDVPVIWHSDGNIIPLLPPAVEAGFRGVHGLEPVAGIDLAQVKAEYGEQLILIGNIDVNHLCGSDLDAVRADVDRCLRQGAPGGGYLISTSNSIFAGMNGTAVAEMFTYLRRAERAGPP
jgi:uroporphyrinogen decarboxylase